MSSGNEISNKSVLGSGLVAPAVDLTSKKIGPTDNRPGWKWSPSEKEGRWAIRITLLVISSDTWSRSESHCEASHSTGRTQMKWGWVNVTNIRWLIHEKVFLHYAIMMSIENKKFPTQKQTLNGSWKEDVRIFILPSVDKRQTFYDKFRAWIQQKAYGL